MADADEISASGSQKIAGVDSVTGDESLHAEVLDINGKPRLAMVSTGVDDGGNSTNLKTDEFGNALMRPTDGERKTGGIGFDGFGRQIVATTSQVFEEGFQNGFSEENWVVTETNGGTVTATEGEGVYTTTTAADAASTRTVIRHQFFHGFSITWRVRVYIGEAGNADVIREWGIFDTNNGYFFRYRDGGLYTVIRRLGVDREVLVTTDATGNHNLNPNTGDAGSFEIQYLDGNAVRFYVGPYLTRTEFSGTANLITNSNQSSNFIQTQVNTTAMKTMKFYGLAVVRDGAPFRFNTSGELVVSSGLAQTPPGADSVIIPSTDPLATISPGGTVDIFYTITTDMVLTIQTLKARVESAGTGKGVRVELFSDPTGSTPTPSTNVDPAWIRIDTLMGNNFNTDAPQSFTNTGDGTARVLLRVVQTGSASMDYVAQWRGFEA